MKIKYTLTQRNIEFDVDAELARINTFDEDEKPRHLNIFNFFLNQNYTECYAAIMQLPYSETHECSEVEFVSSFILTCSCKVTYDKNITLSRQDN